MINMDKFLQRGRILIVKLLNYSILSANLDNSKFALFYRNPILSHPVAFRKILNYPNLIQKMAKNGKKWQKIAF